MSPKHLGKVILLNPGLRLDHLRLNGGNLSISLSPLLFIVLSDIYARNVSSFLLSSSSVTAPTPRSENLPHIHFRISRFLNPSDIAHHQSFTNHYPFSGRPRESHRNGRREMSFSGSSKTKDGNNLRQATHIHYPFWFGGSASCFAAAVTHPLDLSTSI